MQYSIYIETPESIRGGGGGILSQIDKDPDSLIFDFADLLLLWEKITLSSYSSCQHTCTVTIFVYISALVDLHTMANDLIRPAVTLYRETDPKIDMMAPVTTMNRIAQVIQRRC